MTEEKIEKRRVFKIHGDLDQKLRTSTYFDFRKEKVYFFIYFSTASWSVLKSLQEVLTSQISVTLFSLTFHQQSPIMVTESVVVADLTVQVFHCFFFTIKNLITHKKLDISTKISLFKTLIKILFMIISNPILKNSISEIHPSIT